MEDFTKILSNMAAAAEKMRKEMEDKELAIKKKEESLQYFNSKFKEGETADVIIEFNVGGRHFATHKDTLLQFENTYFSALLSGRFPVMKDAKGRYFIDRSPEAFEVILDWMRRNGRLTRTQQQKGGTLDTEAFLAEIEYFGLTEVWKASQPAIVAAAIANKMFRLTRMQTKDSGSWSYSGPSDRVQVSPSKKVILWGISLYGSLDSVATITISKADGMPLIQMTDVPYTKRAKKDKKKQKKKKKDAKDAKDAKDDEKGKEKEDDKGKEKEKDGDEKDKDEKGSAESTRPPVPPGPNNIYDVLFPNSVKLKKGRNYIIAAKITGSSTTSGTSGNATVTQKKVTFSFSTVSGDNNGTSNTSGQIPCLLWSRCPKVPVPGDAPKEGEKKEEDSKKTEKK